MRIRNVQNKFITSNPYLLPFASSHLFSKRPVDGIFRVVSPRRQYCEATRKDFSKGISKVDVHKAIQVECSQQGNPDDEVFSQFAVSTNNHRDPWKAIKLIEAFGKQRNLDKAFSVFNLLAESQAITEHVAAILAKICVDNDEPRRAVPFLWNQLKRSGLRPSKMCFGYLVRACARSGDSDTAHELFTAMNNSSSRSSTWTANSIDCTQIVQAIGCRSTARSITNEHNLNTIRRCEEVFDWMLDKNVEPQGHFYAVLFGVCGEFSESGGEELGRRVHQHLQRNFALRSDRMLNNALISMYGKCGDLEEAQRIFDSMNQRNLVTWNAMISAYTQQGHPETAIALFTRMRQGHRDLVPNERTLCSALNACASIQDLQLGGKLHESIRIDAKLSASIEVNTALIAMYAKCGELSAAHEVFENLDRRDLVTWNVMITAYVDHERFLEAIALFRRMQTRSDVRPDRNTLLKVLQACGATQDIEAGNQLRDLIRRDERLEECVVMNTSLISMYGKCGNLEEARRVFNSMEQRNLVTWNAMISAYSQQGSAEVAIELFKQMQRDGDLLPDSVTLNAVLKACGDAPDIELGKQLHKRIDKDSLLADNRFLRNTLISMYESWGELERARQIFDSSNQPDLVTWNAMIAAYVHGERPKEALHLYRQMHSSTDIRPDRATVCAVLKACGEADDVELGRHVHDEIRRDEDLLTSHNVDNALIAMYCKSGDLAEARRVFDNKFEPRDLVTWNAMISGYAQNQRGKEAVELFERMKSETNLQPDNVTLCSVLSACGATGRLGLGQELHASIIERGIFLDGRLRTALVFMYSKCNLLSESERIWRNACQESEQPQELVGVWNAMIGAYGEHGYGEKALATFKQMVSTFNHAPGRSITMTLQPNSITFINTLTACSHAGLVDEAIEMVETMNTSFGIRPSIMHHNCVLDALARANRLDEAKRYLDSMSDANEISFKTLLGAARTHRNVELAEEMGRRLKLIAPRDAATRVLLSNAYAVAGRNEERDAERDEMRRDGIESTSCVSSIDIEGRIHSLRTHEREHPRIIEIRNRFRILLREIKAAGYSFDKSHLPPGLTDDDDIESHLSGHSEKLAISLGLISTPPGTPLTLVQNLRMCPDCHLATKYIAKVTGRSISVRDANRWHHFDVEGRCRNCNDYK